MCTESQGRGIYREVRGLRSKRELATTEFLPDGGGSFLSHPRHRVVQGSATCAPGPRACWGSPPQTRRCGLSRTHPVRSVGGCSFSWLPAARGSRWARSASGKAGRAGRVHAQSAFPAKAPRGPPPPARVHAVAQDGSECRPAHVLKTLRNSSAAVVLAHWLSLVRVYSVCGPRKPGAGHLHLRAFTPAVGPGTDGNGWPSGVPGWGASFQSGRVMEALPTGPLARPWGPGALGGRGGAPNGAATRAPVTRDGCGW